MNEHMDYHRYGRVNVPSYYLPSLYDHIRGIVSSSLYYDVIETLGGKVKITVNEINLSILLITTLQGKKSTVGFVIPEDELLEIPIRVVAEKLAQRFIHTFTVLAMSVLVKPLEEDSE